MTNQLSETMQSKVDVRTPSNVATTVWYHTSSYTKSLDGSRSTCHARSNLNPCKMHISPHPRNTTRTHEFQAFVSGSHALNLANSLSCTDSNELLLQSILTCRHIRDCGAVLGLHQSSAAHSRWQCAKQHGVIYQSETDARSQGLRCAVFTVAQHTQIPAVEALH